jgi:hypothetical protein
MMTCSSCGRPIEKVPDWLQSTKVDFVCNNCPNRQAKNIAFLSLETAAPAAKVEEEPDVEEVADEEEEV